jgi:predicted transcriptional regulator
MRTAILDALESRYEAQVLEANATIKIYLENSVGIGEHPQHIDEIDKQLQKISEAEEKLEALKRFRIERAEL